MKKLNYTNQYGLFLPETTEWVKPAFLPDWRDCPLIALDLEGRDDGLAKGIGPGWAFKDHGFITGFSICNGEKQFYFPIRHPDSDNFDIDAAHRWIKEHVTRPGGETIFHNASFDTGWILKEIGIQCQNVSDTMVAACMVDENRYSYSLDNLCKAYGIPGKDTATLNDAARALAVDPKNEMWKLPSRFVGAYAEQDAAATYMLYSILKPEMEKQDLIKAYRVECDLIEVCMRMRMRGIRVDEERLEELRKFYFAKRDKLLVQLTDHVMIGRKIGMEDVLSSKRLAEFFDKEGLTYPYTTKASQPSFESDWLEAQDHWLPKTIASIRKFDQAADKFLTGYIKGSLMNGRIHAEIHQLRDKGDERTGGGGTRSHRLAYANPPLQQMPAQDPDIGKSIREVFLPEEGTEWSLHDLDQQEPRMTVHYAVALKVAGWEQALRYYRDNPDADFHQMTNVLIWGDEATKDSRKKAKTINLGLAYGMGKKKLARKLGLSDDEAEELFDIYHNRVPFMRALSRTCTQKVQVYGFIRLIDGARCHFDLWLPFGEYGAGFDIETAKKRWPSAPLQRADAHKAMNRLVQGSAARQTKHIMLNCYRQGFLPMLQMHDDLSFSVGSKDDSWKIQELMNTTMVLNVPIKSDVEIGPSWGKVEKIAGKV